jgi:phosphoribosyl 1,2-cyclic phosphodiesterase
MSLKWAILGSGSKANSYLFEHDEGAFVIDNGFPLKDFKKRAAQAGLDHRKVNTVLLTHTHGDHIRGLESLLASTGALLVHRRGIRIEAVLRKLKHVPAMLVDANTSYDVAGVAFYPFDLSHDAPHATSYHFKAGGTRFTLITDTGRTDATMLKLAARSDVLFLEANYCPHLLEHGPYPPVLRDRVAGDRGHLSNHQAADFLNQLADRGEGPSKVYLVHLSENNNTPERVAEVLRAECRYKGELRVCHRNELVVGV